MECRFSKAVPWYATTGLFAVLLPTLSVPALGMGALVPAPVLTALTLVLGLVSTAK